MFFINEDCYYLVSKMNIFKYLLVLFIFFIYSFSVKAQDSLDRYNLEILSNKINATTDSTLRFIYIDKFIEKAKKENNILSLKAGYFYRYNSSKNDSVKLQSLNHILEISETNPDPIFTPIAHNGKAYFYRARRDFKKALDAFLKANEYAKNENDKRCFFQSNLQIGILKDRIGNHKEALKIHKENINFAETNNDIISQKDNLNAVFALAFTYKNLKQLDSATYFNDYGMKKSKENNFSDLYHYFLLNKGIIQFLKENYPEAKKLLDSAKHFFSNNKHLPNTAEANFYLGKVELEFGHTKKAIFHLKKVDSIFDKMNDLIPEIRETYYILSEHYKSQKDVINQLKYIQKLIQADSILNSNYIYINENLKYKYDIPKYTAEKEELIKSLEIQSKSKNYYFLLVLLLAFGVIVYLIKRQLTLKNRFNSLIKEQAKEEPKTNKNQIGEIELDIPEDILKNIINSIKEFEKKNQFIDSKITLTSLAKKFNTNTTYLSKTINHLKNKNINSYLNDLRIDFAVEKIKNDSKFRKYTIKAIASDVGFKSSETFSKTFVKKTGLRPSYFIKQIEKSEKFN